MRAIRFELRLSVDEGYPDGQGYDDGEISWQFAEAKTSLYLEMDIAMAESPGAPAVSRSRRLFSYPDKKARVRQIMPSVQALWDSYLVGVQGHKATHPGREK